MGFVGGIGLLIFLLVKFFINFVIDNKFIVLFGNIGKRWYKGYICVGVWI